MADSSDDALLTAWIKRHVCGASRSVPHPIILIILSAGPCDAASLARLVPRAAVRGLSVWRGCCMGGHRSMHNLLLWVQSSRFLLLLTLASLLLVVACLLSVVLILPPLPTRSRGSNPAPKQQAPYTSHPVPLPGTLTGPTPRSPMGLR